MSREAAWKLWQLADLSIPWALRVITTLGLPDLIAEGIDDVAQLSARTETDQQALLRVLRCCAAHEVLKEHGDGRFELTELGECLRAEDPSRMAAWLRTDGAAGKMDRTFCELMHSVRTGKAAYPQRHGMAFYDDLAAHPELRQSFDDLMQGDATDYRPIVDHLPRVGRVVDVGGGCGRLIAEILNQDSTVQGAVFETPETAAAARAYLSGFGSRAEVAEGSFFDRVQPSGADLYVLAAVLHNWPDSDAVQILRVVREAAGPGGRVAIIEGVPTEDADPRWISYLDLKMLVMLAGRERTVQHYTELATEAGFGVDDAVVTSRGPFALPCAVLTLSAIA